jgi:type II secretory pathway component GspD/PulD (secretin)
VVAPSFNRMEYVFKRPAARTFRGWPTASSEPPLAAQGAPAAPTSDFRVFRLKNAAAADMERILAKLFPTGGRAGAGLRIASDDRTNSVLVSGPREQLDEVEALLNRLDTPEGGKAPAKK